MRGRAKFLAAFVEFMVQAALDGIGLAYVLEDQIKQHLTQGTLVWVLEPWCFDGYFLYYPSRRHVPGALQALVDALRV